ncbi:hypothetical protein GUJ93_ZPchr0006g42622 [Zizania palustris]|uniref:Signal peptidase complex catalytic subunit SEC11 n=1 Tax=Zizania palustris TaxID=103762 RepID=A0A8J5W4K5_ZIZPA|nr:hypothetical protein GUJ93_ZPchr0006g42622 [Zizania palustris]
MLVQIVSLGMIVTSALIIWKGLIVVTGSESPVVVVLTGSMEPGFKRGDILFLHMSKDPIRTGEIVGREIPIVHRVIKVHEHQESAEVDILTKGDNNLEDDRFLYAHGQLWLQQHHIMGRAVGFLQYVGWVTIFKVCLFFLNTPIDLEIKQWLPFIVHSDRCTGLTGHI